MERKCTECDSGEMDDVKHFGESEELMEKMKKVVTGLDEVEEERNVAWILDLARRSDPIARGVEKLWTVRFMKKKGQIWHMYFSKSHPSPHTCFRLACF